ncbi:MAG: GNAT family N-acetyltransferase [Micromonosporaceae bacterium]
MEIVKVDPQDDEALADWHAAFGSGRAAGREHPANWTLPELAVALRKPGAYRLGAYAAVEQGRTTGGALALLPVRDNLRLLEFEIAVPPAQRRHGVGSALYQGILDLARAEGRSSLLTPIVEAYRGKGPTEGAPFAEKRGFTCRNRELHSVLDLPVDPGRLESMARDAAPFHADYQLRTWVGSCPDELVGGYVKLLSQFMAEVPLGDLDYEPHRWDVERLRAEEQKRVDQARTGYITVAIGAGDELVGHTELLVAGHDPGQAYQNDTLVLPSHRGHRLGVAMKAANLKAMTLAHPDRHRVHTFNAEQNAPMMAVNRAMGFRAVERMGEYQREV